ncbi:MAG TPA: GNAT family N-acetyltransferase [Ilumatobacteraceae bacterium]
MSALSIADADEMVTVLADPALHEFIGGRPATLNELRDRYSAWVNGSGSDGELWLNWIVRRRVDAAAVGTVQATVRQPDAATIATVAWTIGTAWQRRGYATEAATALVAWLCNRGAATVLAHVNPGHVASARVASAAGLRSTDNVADGEVEWRLEQPNDHSV